MSSEGQYFPDFNFTISSKHNDTGHWLADEVKSPISNI